MEYSKKFIDESLEQFWKEISKEQLHEFLKNFEMFSKVIIGAISKTMKNFKLSEGICGYFEISWIIDRRNPQGIAEKICRNIFGGIS